MKKIEEEQNMRCMGWLRHTWDQWIFRMQEDYAADWKISNVTLGANSLFFHLNDFAFLH